jgi:hypothetical protein
MVPSVACFLQYGKGPLPARRMIHSVLADTTLHGKMAPSFSFDPECSNESAAVSVSSHKKHFNSRTLLHPPLEEARTGTRAIFC